MKTLTTISLFILLSCVHAKAENCKDAFSKIENYGLIGNAVNSLDNKKISKIKKTNDNFHRSLLETRTYATESLLAIKNEDKKILIIDTRNQLEYLHSPDQFTVSIMYGVKLTSTELKLVEKLYEEREHVSSPRTRKIDNILKNSDNKIDEILNDFLKKHDGVLKPIATFNRSGSFDLIYTKNGVYLLNSFSLNPSAFYARSGLLTEFIDTLNSF